MPEIRRKRMNIMIQYKILHHVPGRIRIEVPSIKGLSIKVLNRLSGIIVPCGIEDIRPNPLTGSLLIKYDPDRINIIAYLKDMASSDKIKSIINKGGSDEQDR
jgi:hypothetical protein